MAIRITSSGLHTTIQDQGRSGFQRFGFSVSGAMDQFSFRLANLLVRNQPNEAVIEMAVTGASFSFSKANHIAVTGSDCSPKLNGEPLKMNQTVKVEAGDELTTGILTNGAFAYVAIAGGLQITEVMGSRSTSTKYGIGGLDGRLLQEGDTIRFKAPVSTLVNLQSRYVSDQKISDIFEAETIRMIPAEDLQVFKEETIEAFFKSAYSVSLKSDRMGYRMEGPEVETGRQEKVISEATVLGDIQIPPDGQPIVLLADRQTTGGYPVIGTVCSVDIPRLVQSRPGEKIRFVPITLEEAHELLMKQEEMFNKWKTQVNDPDNSAVTGPVRDDRQEHKVLIDWDAGKVKELIDKVDHSSLTYFSCESEHLRLRLDKRSYQPEKIKKSGRGPNKPVSSPVTELIRSPLVGVFYTHSGPDDHIYVEEGDAVRAGQTVGRIEALNISNDVIADKGGTVKSIFVTNDQMVEYGQKIMELEVENEN